MNRPSPRLRTAGTLSPRHNPSKIRSSRRFPFPFSSSSCIFSTHNSPEGHMEKKALEELFDSRAWAQFQFYMLLSGERGPIFVGTVLQLFILNNRICIRRSVTNRRAPDGSWEAISAEAPFVVPGSIESIAAYVTGLGRLVFPSFYGRYSVFAVVFPAGDGGWREALTGGIVIEPERLEGSILLRSTGDPASDEVLLEYGDGDDDTAH